MRPTPARPTPVRPTPVRVTTVTPLASRRIHEQPKSPRKKHAWTLVIVPPHGGRVRNWHLRRWQARLGLLAATLGALALFAGGLTIGARFASEPFAAVDAELADSELRAAAAADTLRAIRIAATTVPTAAAPAEAPLLLPVNGRLASRFTRARRHPILGIWRPHWGLDIAAPSGTRVTAPASGRVRAVHREFAAGLVVEIDHGSGIVTRYLHLRSASVKTGQEVSAGATIATVGSSGLSTGAHLHYEVRVNGRAMDPLRYRLVMPAPPKPTPAVVLQPTR